VKRRSPSDRLLRWYPAAWRDRYGSELSALLDDVRDDEGLSFTRTMAVRRAGLVERWVATGLVGTARGDAQRLRAGSIAVLCAWSLMMVAGASVAKASEHSINVLPVADRALAQMSIDAVAVAGVIGVVAVVIGAAMCVPGFVTFCRRGGWPFLARKMTVAVSSTVVSAAALVGLVGWAHHLSSSQRNGGSPTYTTAFVALALVGVFTLVAWTTVAVAAARRVELSRSILRFEAALALVVVCAMTVVMSGTLTWLVQMTLHAPSFVRGSTTGGVSTMWAARLVATVVAMVVAVAAGLLGAGRVARSWRLVDAND